MFLTISVWLAQIYCYYEWTRLLMAVVFSLYSVMYLFQPKHSYYAFSLVCGKCYTIISSKIINEHLINGGGDVPAARKVVDTHHKECPICGHTHFYPASRIRIYCSYILHLWRFFVNYPVISNVFLLIFLEEYALTYWNFLFWVLQIIFNKSIRKALVSLFYECLDFARSKPKNFTKHVAGISISDIVSFLTKYREETLTINKAMFFFRDCGYEASEHQIRKVMTKLEVDKIIEKDPENQNARILRVSPLRAEQLLTSRIDMKDGHSFHVYRGNPPPLTDKVEFSYTSLH